MRSRGPATYRCVGNAVGAALVMWFTALGVRGTAHAQDEPVPEDPEWTSPDLLDEPERDSGGQGCAWSLGVAANHAPPRRSFALLTPEGSWSVTPVLSSQCSPVSALRLRPWVGLDAVPTLQHSYRGLAERRTLLVLARMGMDVTVAPHVRVGGHLSTNLAAWGFGARLRVLPPPRRGFGVRGVELRVGMMAGETPDLQAMALVHLHHRWVGEHSETSNLDRADWRQTRRWYLASGFEIGAITAFRLQVTPGRPGSMPEIGIRAGALTNLFADAAVQPVALVHVDVPLDGADGVLQLVPQLGTTRRDGRWGPLTGVAFEIDPQESAVQAHIGALLGQHEGQRWLTIDAGVAWLW